MDIPERCVLFGREKIWGELRLGEICEEWRRENGGSNLLYERRMNRKRKQTRRTTPQKRKEKVTVSFVI